MFSHSTDVWLRRTHPPYPEKFQQAGHPEHHDVVRTRGGDSDREAGQGVHEVGGDGDGESGADAFGPLRVGGGKRWVAEGACDLPAALGAAAAGPEAGQVVAALVAARGVGGGCASDCAVGGHALDYTAMPRPDVSQIAAPHPFSWRSRFLQSIVAMAVIVLAGR